MVLNQLAEILVEIFLEEIQDERKLSANNPGKKPSSDLL